jgi:hypothetical protein
VLRVFSTISKLKLWLNQVRMGVLVCWMCLVVVFCVFCDLLYRETGPVVSVFCGSCVGNSFSEHALIGSWWSVI